MITEPGNLLRGRRDECDVLDRVVDDVRQGRSRVMVIRGEPGIGKSALLDYLDRTASGCRVIRIVGVEHEMELAFAGLHQLCSPLLELRHSLPEPQRDALEAAFGLAQKSPPDRFVVGLAVLGLLSSAAGERPIVCIIDDAQWLDRASVLTISFVARRLLAESMGIVLAVRDDGEASELAGLPTVQIKGIDAPESLALLGSIWPGRLDDDIVHRVVAESRGNPLALREFSEAMMAAHTRGEYDVPGGGSLASRIERSFLTRLQVLPAETLQLLLTAAAEPIGDASLLWRAADHLGVTADALSPAVSAGLIDLGASVRFRHPLVRSTVYRSASAVERRAVHRALAWATDATADPDRRAWHRAQATAGLDEDVAQELERSADRARARGGVAAAAAFLKRAATLTPDPVLRGHRMLAAARATFETGALDAAGELTAAAEQSPLDALQRARLRHIDAQIAFARGRGSEAPALLLDAAERLSPLDPDAAREAHLEALGAAIYAGRLSENASPFAVAKASLDAPRARSAANSADVLLDGLVARYTAGYASSVPSLRRALDLFAYGENDDDDFVRWFWLPCLVAADLWDDGKWHEISTRAVQLIRNSGALVNLPLALGYRSVVHIHAGQFAEAAMLNAEGDSIEAATGSAPVGYPTVLLAVWRGEANNATEALAWGRASTVERGEGRGIGGLGYTSALLQDGLGRYAAALAAARVACEFDDLGITGFALIERVQAAMHCGNLNEAHEAMDQLAERTSAANTEWALGVQAWCRATLATGADAERLYREAIERLRQTRINVHLGRAQLGFGEWLRRQKRRSEARDVLREAHKLFEGAGALAYADRARRELLATGEVARARTPELADALTPQESQVARLARGGMSNPEIGAQLFISPRTVQYHLRKVFQKLGITSRNQLHRLSGTVLGAGESSFEAW